jgi:hypothetical protein
LRSKNKNTKNREGYISIKGYILHYTDAILTVASGDFCFQFYKKDVIGYELPIEEQRITSSTVILLKLKLGCNLLNLHPAWFYKNLFPQECLPFLIASRQNEEIAFSQSEDFKTLENEFISSLK